MKKVLLLFVMFNTVFGQLHFDTTKNSSAHITLTMDTNSVMTYYDDFGKKEYIFSMRDSFFVELNVPIEKAFARTFSLMLNNFKQIEKYRYEEMQTILRPIEERKNKKIKQKILQNVDGKRNKNFIHSLKKNDGKQ